MHRPGLRMTIGQLMVATFVVALALAPAVVALRSGRQDFVAAAGAFEIIMLPVIVALIVLVMMEPGRARNWVIVGLCLTPALLFFGAFLVALVVGYAMSGPIYLAQGNYLLFFYMFIFWPFLLVARFPRPCPYCGRRRLKPIMQHDPEKKMWVHSGFVRCSACGKPARLVTGRFFTSVVAEGPGPTPPT